MKLNKQILKELRLIAYALPTTYYEVKEGIELSQSQVLDMGINEIEGKEIDLSKKQRIIQNIDAVRQVNHVLRIKRVYKSKGHEGVKLYCEQVMEMYKQQTAPISGIDYGRALI